MISRSDGETFHLLLADRPLAYPQDGKDKASDGVSVCFWYSHVATDSETQTTVVVLPGTRPDQPMLFRAIDFVADLLADRLMNTNRLASLYKLSGDTLQPIPY